MVGSWLVNSGGFGVASAISVVMPRCACTSEVYGGVFVCVSVCVDCYSCSRMNDVQVRVSIGS